MFLLKGPNLIAGQIVKKRTCRMQAVIIRTPKEERSDAEVLRKAKEKVNLQELHIAVTNIGRLKQVAYF